MMKPVLLIDFGSTYTKLTAVDIEDEQLLGTASVYTTIHTDINEGLRKGMLLLEQKTGKMEFIKSFACSSAGGGLRMITSGLVPELTSEAAKLASLGAGAKTVKTYSFQLTDDDIAEIKTSHPEILLLVGGTDGGNSECILHNANALAKLPDEFPIIIAGNRSAAAECKNILNRHKVFICENVMPKFGKLNIEPTQKCIRNIFLNSIVQAKGLSKISTLLSDIIMPTPSAVMQSLELLAKGCEDVCGIGELLAVDVGGATTDVYSIADGMPESHSTVYKGLPEPYSKRTVEGDIGMRYSVEGIVEAAGLTRISQLSDISVDEVKELISYLCTYPDTLPGKNEKLRRLDHALASLAIDIAVGRHTGTMKETYTILGQTFVQTGKDLSQVKNIIVTGGSLIHTNQTSKVASYALYNPTRPTSLRPKHADFWVDRKYILAAMGLLASNYPQVALRIMKKELEYNGHSE